jgi:hypothetical protein
VGIGPVVKVAVVGVAEALLDGTLVGVVLGLVDGHGCGRTAVSFPPDGCGHGQCCTVRSRCSPVGHGVGAGHEG